MTCAFIGIIISLRHVCILRESRPMSHGRVSCDSFIHHHHPPPWPRSEASFPWKLLSCSRKYQCIVMSNICQTCQCIVNVCIFYIFTRMKLYHYQKVILLLHNMRWQRPFLHLSVQCIASSYSLIIIIFWNHHDIVYIISICVVCINIVYSVYNHHVV